jgi:DNA polymerase III sliding clamp (beta) subunit (PCNA family)
VPGLHIPSRLIDATYPDYRAILPAATEFATVANADLASALDRLAAVATDAATPLVALDLCGGQLAVYLARQPLDGTDIIAAKTRGDARIALNLPALSSLVAEFSAERLQLDITDRHILSIQGGDKLGLITECKWQFKEHPSCAAGAGGEADETRRQELK